jgi:hypothetical protein
MANSSAPMSPDLVASLMAPLPASHPSRIRDLRRGYVLIAVAVGVAIVGFAAYVIAATTGAGTEAAGIGAGVAAVGAIPGCVGIAFLVLAYTQKNEA